MIYVNPHWLAHQRKRWMRPDADRYWRHDRERFFKPGTLEGKYDPNQPRVAAGNPDGGQWTSGGGGGSGGAPDQSNHVELDGAARPRETTRDYTGKEPWKSVTNAYRSDGSLAEQEIRNRDGSAILSDFRPERSDASWDERHTVFTTDGSKFTFENTGDAQVIRRGDGELLGKAEWTASGAEEQPIAELARGGIGGSGVRATIQGALTLFTWLSSRQGAEERTVLAFRAFDFQPDTSAPPQLSYVGRLEQDKVEAACPRMGEMQARTDAAADAVRREGLSLTASQYGTAVHTRLKHQIDNLRDPNFRAEVSLLKEIEGRYGGKNTIRIDVFERVGNGTVCIYDIKTGGKGLSMGRITEMTRRAYEIYEDTRRIIVMEARPRR